MTAILQTKGFWPDRGHDHGHDLGGIYAHHPFRGAE
jgi:hypothetical protein